jgi:hypothetical protein
LGVDKEDKMVKWLSLILLFVFLGGCGGGSNLNIVSPSMSENEVRERAKVIMSKKTPPTSSEAAAEKKSPEISHEGAPPKETKHTEGPAVNGELEQKALINLLEKKGIITNKELQDEMEKLRQGSK